MSKKIFFTSDLHFGHDKEFIWEARGFSSLQEMEDKIISNWNSVVDSDDDVYILGDILMGTNDPLKKARGINLLNSLNGNKYIIMGNHDTDEKCALYRICNHVVEVVLAKRIKLGGYKLFLSHFPAFTENYDDKGLKQCWIGLHGHTHFEEKFFEGRPLMYHVGLDAHGCFPVSFDEIIRDIKEKVGEKEA